ncbi:hepatic lectin-like [Mercenaria mercenaria]|uniref:hepatic lectin-like n=1 Tax=Mercenaria mercenaria TaxID=6596 RepID=UPI001E1D2AC4|nr:hepatic lectin-like [Mercenaria mercenaria]
MATIICLLLCLSAFVPSSSCPDGWTPFRGSCYLFEHGGKLSFLEAELYCNQHGGHLVHIDNQAESLFIKDHLTSSKAGRTWIGLTDDDVEGLWQWYGTDISPSFTDWFPGDPNSKNGDEDCVALKSEHHQWYDAPCSTLKTPLCERTAYVDVIG